MIRGIAITLLLLAQSGASLRASETQEDVHAKCLRAEELAERQAGEMIPGRTWTWALDADRSLQQLDELRQDLVALKECETTFERSLRPSQLAKSRAQIRAMNELSQHLERDVGSLEDELRKGHPRRWHVAHDAVDMQKEIQRWRRLHEALWAGAQGT